MGWTAYDALDVNNLVSRFTNKDAAGLPLTDGSELSYEQKRDVLSGFEIWARTKATARMCLV